MFASSKKAGCAVARTVRSHDARGQAGPVRRGRATSDNRTQPAARHPVRVDGALRAAFDRVEMNAANRDVLGAVLPDQKSHSTEGEG